MAKYEIAYSNTYVKNRLIYRDSVILYLDDGKILVSNDFGHPRTEKLEVHTWNPSLKRWEKMRQKNAYTEILWNLHREETRKNRHKKPDNTDYAQMMRHDRRHKNGGGGSRDFVGAITDYECTKNPLHDFRRNMYV
jgi:hypothetical protein